MKLRHLAIVFLFLPLGTYAQFPSDNGEFTVDVVTGCAPLVVTVTHPGCLGSCTYIVGSLSRSLVSGDTVGQPFKTPGVYTLFIATGGGGLNNDQITITVTPNLAPTFDLFTCNGRQVRVNVTDNNYSQYYINYNDASPVINNTTDTHTYAGPPPPPDVFRTVSVRGRNGLTGADNCISNTKSVKVTAALQRDTINQVLVLNGTEIQLGTTPDPTTQYRLMIATNNATSFQLFKTIYNPGTTSEVIPGLRPDDNFYCFRLDTFDPCANAVAAGGSSSVICSTNFDVSAQDPLQNTSTWVTAATSATNNYSNFTLNRDGAQLASPIASNQISYIDASVICNTLYNYQLVTNYADGSQSISMTKSATAFTTQQPPAVDNISAIVGDGNVELEWQVGNGEFSIMKSVSGNYNPLATTTSLTYLDDQYATNNTTCYQISYKDICLNESLPSLEACPIRLSGSVQNDNSISLSWSDYTGWTGGVSHYVVEKFNEQGQLLQTFDPVVATTMIDVVEDFTNQIYTYVVTAIPNTAGITPSVSNEIRLIKNPNLFYPSAFTPNSDGLNDDFKVFGQYVTKFQMRIFNRWGEMLYSSDDLDQSWDGTYKGNLMPEATYVFTAQLTDLAGRTFDRSGSVLLLRKK